MEPKQLGAISEWIATTPQLFLDYETTGLRTRKGARPFSAGFFAPDMGAKLIDFRHTPNGREAVADALKKRDKGRLIAFNMGFEAEHSRTLGVELGGELFDPMAGAYALNELREPYGQFGPLTQKALCWYELKKDPIHAKAVNNWLRQNGWNPEDETAQAWGYDRLPGELLVPYACEDLELGWELYQKIEAKLKVSGQMELVLTDSELGRVVSDIENRGIPIDVEKAKLLIEELSTELNKVYRKLSDALGRFIDVQSNQVLFGLLYGELGLPMHEDVEKHGKVDDDVFAWMLTLPQVKSNPRTTAILEGIRDWKEIAKMRDTYLMPWVYEHQENGLLYTNLNMYGARTRRFSANSPNLQNIPTRSVYAKRIKALILARLGFTTYTMDESQGEFRCFAHYGNDAALVKGYCEDPKFDIHGFMAVLLELTRYDAKHINFGLLFGMGKKKLARKLLRTLEECESILNKYYRKFPGLETLKQQLKQVVHGKGYVQDIFGGRRHLTVQESYKALNTLCQMTLANLIRKAMVRVWPLVKKAGGHVLLQIHDELHFELPGHVEEQKPTLRLVKHAMEDFPQFRVPIRVDAHHFDTNWTEKKELNLAA